MLSLNIKGVCVCICIYFFFTNDTGKTDSYDKLDANHGEVSQGAQHEMRFATKHNTPARHYIS